MNVSRSYRLNVHSLNIHTFEREYYQIGIPVAIYKFMFFNIGTNGTIYIYIKKTPIVLSFIIKTYIK